jgi:hypothetical protein
MNIVSIGPDPKEKHLIEGNENVQFKPAHDVRDTPMHWWWQEGSRPSA